MTRRAQGRGLLALGGWLLVLGSFLPEVVVVAGNGLHRIAARTGAAFLDPGPPRALPGRSHWAVFVENVDVLAHPDPYVATPWTSVLDYALQATGLAWLALAGALLAASSLVRASRFAALVAFLCHGCALLGLSAGALALAIGLPSDDPGTVRESRMIALAGSVLLVLFLAEVVAGRWALRTERRGGLAPVDRASAVPTVFLLLSNASLFAALRTHPNWPSAGYLVGAIGASLALVGMALRRDAAGSAA